MIESYSTRSDQTTSQLIQRVYRIRARFKFTSCATARCLALTYMRYANEYAGHRWLSPN